MSTHTHTHHTPPTHVCRVTVLNVNENAPAFDRPNYAGSVGENIPSGTTVATVSDMQYINGVPYIKYTVITV